MAHTGFRKVTDMKIAVIGAGSVGGTLARGWAKKGHDVAFGVRSPSKHKGDIQAVSVADAAASAEIVVLATPWEAASDAIREAGSLAGKVLLDCTNPLKPDLSGLALSGDESGGEHVQRQASGAKVVKIFNTTGFDNMANPVYGNDRVTMLYCGDYADAKQRAAQLAADLGFDPVDAGSLSAARMLESFALLWIHLAIQQKMGRDFAFKVIRR
jgi:hypothetical protein